MGTNSNIEWTDHTWNPWIGCQKVSPGCDNCYMMRDVRRFGMDGTAVYASVKTFNAPLAKNRAKGWKWQDGSKIFVCSWSDFFHSAADSWRGEAWDTIRRRPGLIFQILTKRPENIFTRLPDDWGGGWPNVWLGVTAENQEMADTRVTWLLSIPAARRFVSIEPMLGAVDLTRLDTIKAFDPSAIQRYGDAAPRLKWNALSNNDGYNGDFTMQTGEEMALLDWVIVGGESGPNARPMHPDWVRSLRDQCRKANVAFFFKQWGDWGKADGENWSKDMGWLLPDGRYAPDDDDPDDLYDMAGSIFVGRYGKKKTGCLLDGREWKEFPA